MKILIVRTIAIEEDLKQKTYNNQGIGLATELAKLGNECGLVYFAKKGNQRDECFASEGIRLQIYHIEGKSIVWNALYNTKLYEICRNYDIIQTSECDQIASWQIYKRFPEKTVIYHGPYSSEFTWKYNLRSKVFDLFFSWRNDFKHATVIAKSELAEKYLQKKGFSNIKVLGVGLNPSMLEKPCSFLPNDIEKLIKGKGNDKYLLYIGAISKRKNLMFILEIFNNLINIKKHTNYKLIIVGGKAYKEEAYYASIFNYIKDNHLEDNVIYFDSIEQHYLKYLYQYSDLYLLATQYDIFGMVYLEAMYYGTPILTTLCGGASLLVNNGITGFICPLDEHEKWINTAEKLLENAESLKEIRKNEEQLIKNYFLWSKLAPKFSEVYNELLQRS